MKPLHDLNPTRVKYISTRCELKDRRVLDVGCGGGILSESLARLGAVVTGIDVAPRVIEVAELHLLETGLRVEYELTSVEKLASERPAEFDVVTCLEMLEHVPDPQSIVSAISRTLKPGGHLFLSTLNRTPLAFLMGIVGAEHVARLLPRGTHRYDRFIRPSELATWLRQAGFSVRDICGLHYNPIARHVKLGGNVNVNYLVHAELTAP